MIDLSNFAFEQNYTVALNGEWEFYWKVNSFQDINKKTNNYINVPGSWRGVEINNRKLTFRGKALFRLKVILPQAKENYKIYYSLPYQATQCFVNRKLVAEGGEFSTLKNQHIPSYNTISKGFKLETDTIELIIVVENFYNQKAGVFSPVLLGLEHKVDKIEKEILFEKGLIIGFFLIIFFFHLILFMLRPIDLSYLYFSISSFSIGGSVFIISGVLEFLFPEVSFKTNVQLDAIFLELSPLFLYLFIFKLFPNEYTKIASKITTLSWSILIVACFIPLVGYLNKTYLIITQLVLFVNSIYSIYVLILAFIRKREDSGKFLIGLSIFILAMVNDTLHNMNIIQTGSYVEYGLLGFFLVQSFIISARFSRAFTKNEILTDDLKELNENLEERVVERTQTIEEQKEKIESQRDRLVELDKFKQGLNAMIVHDLKNPLNAILNMSNPDLRGGLAAVPVKERQEIVNQSGREMLRMVMNILEVEKFEDSKMELKKDIASINDTIQKALNQIEFLSRQKQLNIKTDISEEIITAYDNEIISRVLVNLLTNAIKFSPAEGQLTVSANIFTAIEALYEEIIKKIPESYTFAEQNLFVSVQDTGIGIPKEQQPRIFDKFGQVSAKHSGGVKSTGLGLTFCKLAVEAHEGIIGVTSTEGEGSTFWFIIPAIDAETKELSENQNFEPVSGNEEPELTEEDNEVLERFLPRFRQYKFYEATSVTRLLEELAAFDSPGLNRWRHLIFETINNCNEKQYEELTKTGENVQNTGS